MDELVKRKSISDVVGYSKLFSGNDYYKHFIEQFTLESRSKVRVELVSRQIVYLKNGQKFITGYLR
ncbi:hypothetical protein SAMN04487995_6006 [Dyadobacter koreensis]|uniref:Uncharacterized protein n=2 Tax=Dyadobacter koreensis TaxID=408657 RepID=A0A1H7B8P2_9BACT|nr:hypothetical protein SAMN04487995_6006 [Dyadobacter koreensis]